MNKFVMTAAAACFALGSAAHATPISVTVLDADLTNYNNAIAGSSVVEDFEALGNSLFDEPDTIGGLIGGSLATSVGTFKTADDEQPGEGTACIPSGDCIADLYLKKDETSGQENSIPLDGEWALNSNDTVGFIWDVFLAGNKAFTGAVFVLMDAADNKAEVEITASNGETYTLSDLGNAVRKLIVIDFGERVTSASVKIANVDGNILNDGSSLDGAAAVGVVPLPAGGLLLLTGFGALALRRRRKAA